MFYVDGGERLKLFRLVAMHFPTSILLYACRVYVHTKYLRMYMATSNSSAPYFCGIKNLFEIINFPKME